jgi:gamma-glutamylcyclotransferase (GGCT)/AIG2-like uncharacterized protein YtfP
LSEETMKLLQKENTVEVMPSRSRAAADDGKDEEEGSTAKKKKNQVSKSPALKLKFDEDGEFSTPDGQIPVSRLVDYHYNKKMTMSEVDHALLELLFTYQRPDSSMWKMPFVRYATNHVFDRGNLTVWVYMYFTRLIFELIADPAIKKLISRIEGSPFVVHPTLKRRNTVPMFYSKSKEMLQKELFKFSLAGLLKYAENDGYPVDDSDPDGLKVQMYEFQRSTYQWMLDQERDPGGLNRRFWEVWVQEGGQPMYYFAEAGELRLQEPPLVSGGLLCEEMGLGKTVEILALILGNPKMPETSLVSSSDKVSRGKSKSGDCSISLSNSFVEPDISGKEKIDTKATLIVVPPTLLGNL